VAPPGPQQQEEHGHHQQPQRTMNEQAEDRGQVIRPVIAVLAVAGFWPNISSSTASSAMNRPGS